MPGPSPNGVGFTKRWKCAYSHPARHARSAASRKVCTRSQYVFAPKDSATTAPPRSARIARPVRDESRFCAATAASATTPHTSQKYARPSVRGTPRTESAGMPRRPVKPPVKDALPNT